MNFFHTVHAAFVRGGMTPDTAGYATLFLCLIVIIAVLWHPYLWAAERYLRKQRAEEEAMRLAEEEAIRPEKDAARVLALRIDLEDRDRLERARAESLAALAIFEAEQQRLFQESMRADAEFKQIKKHLADTKPEYERAMQMGHEVLAIQARDADIRQAGGEPPPFCTTQVMRAVNQQLYDHRVTGHPITQPAFMEYAQHPCMR